MVSGDANRVKAADPALPFVRRPFSRKELSLVMDNARR
jgi:hypothetical protein